MTEKPLIPTLLCVVGARPNFMKVAPICAALNKKNSLMRQYLVHTGQHYDKEMKDAFFHQLGIPEPDVDLDVGSGTHAVQTAQIMLRFEPILDEIQPFAVLVVGDVNSTIACSLVAVKKGIPVIHVEAGLRSYDREMPEEINRVLTDQLADLLFTTESNALDNLLKEGVDPENVRFVGNVMIDSLRNHLAKSIDFKETLSVNGCVDLDKLKFKNYALLTLHRPSNVDNGHKLKRLLAAFEAISSRIPIIFPVHPRTEKMIRHNGLVEFFDLPNLYRLPAVGYLEILGLMKAAKFVLTDSGGIQEETTAMGIPCITLRENTERPVTVSEGTNTIAGSDASKIMACVDDIFETGGKAGKVPNLWDGNAAKRIVATIEERYL